MIALFERFELRMTMAEANAAFHQGDCDADVEALCKDRGIIRQLDKIGPDRIRDELREYGAWNDKELSDDSRNRRRIVWIAAGNIVEESRS